MNYIEIKVRNKRAAAQGSPSIICGNSDYAVVFDFDDEWSLTGPKTARFVYVKGGSVQHEDVVFSGDTVAVPIMADVPFVKVGVFEGNLCTTTPARIPCVASILCGSGAPEDPSPDVYAQIMELFTEMAEEGAFGATEEQMRRVKVLEARVNTFTKLDEGATTADAEVADIRVGYNGETYETAGEAVRGQFGQLLNITQEQREEIDAELQEEVELLAPAIVLTASGESLAAPDSAARRPQGLRLLGRTYQKSASGKNLLDTSNFTSQTVSGVSFTRAADGCIVANGTAAKNITLSLGEVGTPTSEHSYDFQHTLSGCSGGSASTYYLQAESIEGEFKCYSEEITYAPYSSSFISIVIKSGTSMNNVAFYPMVRLSTNTDGTYEPYDGGVAMPSPDYPQELVSEGAPSGKNLLANSVPGENFATVTQFGVTIQPVYEGGLLQYIRVKGTNTAGKEMYDFSGYYLDPLPTGRYILTGTPAGIFDKAGMLLNVNGVSTEVDETGLAFDYTNGQLFVLSFYVRPGETVDAKFYPMIRVSTDTDPTYEPPGQRYIGVEVYGKNLLQNTWSTDTYEDVLFETNGDGSVLVDGTCADIVKATIAAPTLLAGDYILSGCPSGGGASTYALELLAIVDGAVRVIGYDTGAGLAFSISKATRLQVSILVETGATVPGLTFYPMLCLAKFKDRTFEPYKAKQTFAVPAPKFYGLPGLPVASGGNYTDENGQQWLCDEVDCARGKIVHRVSQVTLEGAESWTYNADTNSADGGYAYRVPFSGSVDDGAALCSHLKNCTLEGRAVGKFRIQSSFVEVWSNLATVDEWKAFLAENPITILYERATPLGADLTTFQALGMNYPATTILNDADVAMVADYVADTKLYIDNKLAELMA